MAAPGPRGVGVMGEFWDSDADESCLPRKLDRDGRCVAR